MPETPTQSQCDSPRSINDIAQSIIDAAPHVEPFVEEVFEWLAYHDARTGPVFRCQFCEKPVPEEWGADRRCEQHPSAGKVPGYMQSCEFVRVR